MSGDSTMEKARAYGFRLLTARPRSEKEFRSKLAGKGFDAAVVDAVAGLFAAQGWLQDGAFASQWARNLAVNRLWSDRKIRASLRERGIDEDLGTEALAQARQEITERAALLRLLVKKGRGKVIIPEDYREKQKVIRSLLGRGFPSGLIFEILSGTGEEELHDGE